MKKQTTYDFTRESKVNDRAKPFAPSSQVLQRLRKEVETKLKRPDYPDAAESEKLIAFGIASDWVKRAAWMKQIEYQGKRMNRSDRSETYIRTFRV